ncbi:MAG: hypothetical protein ACO3IZ_06425, partial [Steroidobacteraceae bacterium]
MVLIPRNQNGFVEWFAEYLCVGATNSAVFHGVAGLDGLSQRLLGFRRAAMSAQQVTHAEVWPDRGPAGVPADGLRTGP